MAKHLLQPRGQMNKLFGKNPRVVIVDDIVEVPKVEPHCVLRVRPVTKALWKLYGAPRIAHHFHEWAFREILARK